MPVFMQCWGLMHFRQVVYPRPASGSSFTYRVVSLGTLGKVQGPMKEPRGPIPCTQNQILMFVMHPSCPHPRHSPHTRTCTAQNVAPLGGYTNPMGTRPAASFSATITLSFRNAPTSHFKHAPALPHKVTQKAMPIPSQDLMSLSSKTRVGFRVADSASGIAYLVTQGWLYLGTVEEGKGDVHLAPGPGPVRASPERPS